MAKAKTSYLLPILMSFFVMGFVDMVSTATGFVKRDFDLSDTLSNLIPMLVFLWFFLISIPTGVLMGRLGRKNTVILSAAITTLGLLLPVISYTFPVVLAAFVLLGFGNTILQVSLNPLLTDVVPMERYTSNLTFGQFVKAISSFLGPILLATASAKLGNWTLIFPVFAAVTALSGLWLLFLPIKEKREDAQTSSMGRVFALLKDKRILLFFSVIVLQVGYEVGLTTAAPKYLQEQFGIPLEDGAFVNSLYFAARTIGLLLGSFLLTRIPIQKFFASTMALALIGYVLMMAGGVYQFYTGVFFVGLFCANIFAIAFSLAMQHDPAKSNEISALMITGVAGGALIPPIMGGIADVSNQFFSLTVPFACLVFIFFVALSQARKKTV